MIVLVCGPPAAGKTTVAARLRERLAAEGRQFELLHSDAFSRRTYERLYERVAGSDADWIVDGTFYRREWQEQFRALPGARLVSVTADRETCVRRNRERADAIDECTLAEAIDRVERAIERWSATGA